MKKLYEKSQLTFALVWIGIYVAGMSVLEGSLPALPHAAAALGAAVMSLCLLLWLHKRGLGAEFGLRKCVLPALWYFPLGVITISNLSWGVTVTAGTVETVLFVLKMLCVGFLEELIFRGFLFRALCKDSVKWAAAVSSVTFGLGHIVNLFNGSGMTVAENLTQILCAIAMGFLYVVIFLRGRSLLPCILSHGLFNSLSIFAREAPPEAELPVRVAMCLLAAVCGVILCRTAPKKE